MSEFTPDLEPTSLAKPDLPESLWIYPDINRETKRDPESTSSSTKLNQCKKATATRDEAAVHRRTKRKHETKTKVKAAVLQKQAAGLQGAAGEQSEGRGHLDKLAQEGAGD